MIHPKMKILRIIGILKRSARVYPFRNFYEIFGICGHFHVRLMIKIWGFPQGFRVAGFYHGVCFLLYTSNVKMTSKSKHDKDQCFIQTP